MVDIQIPRWQKTGKEFVFREERPPSPCFSTTFALLRVRIGSIDIKMFFLRARVVQYDAACTWRIQHDLKNLNGVCRTFQANFLNHLKHFLSFFLSFNFYNSIKVRKFFNRTFIRCFRFQRLIGARNSTNFPAVWTIKNETPDNGNNKSRPRVLSECFKSTVASNELLYATLCRVNKKIWFETLILRNYIPRKY